MEQSQSSFKADGAQNKDKDNPEQKNESASIADISDTELDPPKDKEQNQ